MYCSSTQTHYQHIIIATLSGDTEFVSKLDEKSLKVAKEELHERNEKDRLLAVQTFRQWVLEQKWLRTPTGIVYSLCL